VSGRRRTLRHSAKGPVLPLRRKGILDEPGICQRPAAHADPLQVVGIGPIGDLVRQAVNDRVGMDVAAQVQQAGLHLNGLYPVLTFEQRPAVFVVLVARFTVAVEHPLGQERGRLLGSARGAWLCAPYSQPRRFAATLASKASSMAASSAARSGSDSIRLYDSLGSVSRSKRNGPCRKGQYAAFSVVNRR
jgi:hypothetical protein